MDEPILFDSVKIAAFGMHDFDEKATDFAHILYFKDDNNFILKLTPTNNQHEIILVKGLEKFQTLGDALTIINKWIEVGKQQLDNQIAEKDIFSIPIIKFNIETKFKRLEGQHVFTEDKNERVIKVAYQRTGFILNANGAKVESEAKVVVDMAKLSMPKTMIFDKPFLIIIKKVDKPNPYFVMKVANTELLVKK